MEDTLVNDSVDSSSKHDEWLKGALGVDIQVARPKNTGGDEPETPEQAHRRELDAQVDKRRAKRDARVDEYGIQKPAASWTEKIADDVAPPEIMNDPSTPWYEVLGRATVGSVGAAIYGHFLDNLSPVDTRGDWHPPVPILGEIAHGEAEAQYERKRAAYEEELKKQEEAENQASEEREDDDPQDPAENEGVQSKAPDDGQVCDPNATSNTAPDTDPAQPVSDPDQPPAPDSDPDVSASASEPQQQVCENPTPTTSADIAAPQPVCDGAAPPAQESQPGVCDSSTSDTVPDVTTQTSSDADMRSTLADSPSFTDEDAVCTE